MDSIFQTTPATERPLGQLIEEARGSAVTEYSWNNAFELVGVDSPGDDVINEFDALGRRVTQTVNANEVSSFIFDQSARVLSESPTGEVTHQERALNGLPIAQAKASDWSQIHTVTPDYYHTDALTSPIALSSLNDGSLLSEWDYEAFGAVRAHSGSASSELGYLSNPLTINPKSLDFNARSYDPELARFTSRDPIPGLTSAPQSLNPYAYGLNNPNHYPDPTGLFAEGLADGWMSSLGVFIENVPGNLYDAGDNALNEICEYTACAFKDQFQKHIGSWDVFVHSFGVTLQAEFENFAVIDGPGIPRIEWGKWLLKNSGNDLSAKERNSPEYAFGSVWGKGAHLLSSANFVLKVGKWLEGQRLEWIVNLRLNS